MAERARADRNAIQARGALVVSGRVLRPDCARVPLHGVALRRLFYGVYGPGLDWLQGSGTTSWLIQFFLPHVVEQTDSLLVDNLGLVGTVLLIAGLAGFAVGAIQVYYAKLTGRAPSRTCCISTSGIRNTSP